MLAFILGMFKTFIKDYAALACPVGWSAKHEHHATTLPRYHATTLPRYHASVNMMKVWAWEKYLFDIKSVPRWGYVLLGPSVSHVFSVMEAWIIVDLLSSLLVNCSWPNSAKVRLIPRSLSTAETRGVLSFESYPRTFWIARSAKNFFVRGLRNFVRG